MPKNGFVTEYKVSSQVRYTAHLSTVGNRQYNVAVGETTFSVVSVDDFMEPGEVNDMSMLLTELRRITDLFNDAILVKQDDPILLQHMQPKTGHSVQEWLAYIKEQMEEPDWGAHPFYRGYLIGREVPPSTHNGLKIFVTKNEPTLEFLAVFVLTVLSLSFKVDRVIAKNGDFEVTVYAGAQPTLL